MGKNWKVETQPEAGFAIFLTSTLSMVLWLHPIAEESMAKTALESMPLLFQMQTTGSHSAWPHP